MKLYKLTDENGQTYNKTQWGENITHHATGSEDQDLCSDGWIHAYESPLLAVLMNPIHSNFANPILWEAEGEIGKTDRQLKCGCRSLTTIKKIPLPQLTTSQKVSFAILVAKEVFKDKDFQIWADNWLVGKDKTYDAAYAAARAARSAVYAADAAYAAYAAAAYAYATAYDAAYDAARAADRAARVARVGLNLIKIAEIATSFV